jgi:hypothetical protein
VPQPISSIRSPRPQERRGRRASFFVIGGGIGDGPCAHISARCGPSRCVSSCLSSGGGFGHGAVGRPRGFGPGGTRRVCGSSIAMRRRRVYCSKSSICYTLVYELAGHILRLEPGARLSRRPPRKGRSRGAARVLKTTQPTVGRQIGALEETLGVTLVERSVRGLHADRSGPRTSRPHARHGRGRDAHFPGGGRQIARRHGRGHGDGNRPVCPPRSCPGCSSPCDAVAPGIRVRILASSELENLTQRDADIAIRHVRPDQSDLIARHLGDFRANLYAASPHISTVRAARARRATSPIMISSATPTPNA